LANTSSARKRIRQSEKRRVKNSSMKSALRTSIKKLRSSASEKASKDVLSTNQSKVDKTLDSAARKGLIHWKKAARLKSRLAKMVNSVVK